MLTELLKAHKLVITQGKPLWDRSHCCIYCTTITIKNSRHSYYTVLHLFWFVKKFVHLNIFKSNSLQIQYKFKQFTKISWLRVKSLFFQFTTNNSPQFGLLTISTSFRHCFVQHFIFDFFS